MSASDTVVPFPSPGTTVDDVRRQNLGQVLRIAHRDGPLSRAQITRATGLNRSTVGGLVQELHERGLLDEYEAEHTRKVGRPSPRVSASDSTVALSINPEVDAIDVATVGLSGRVLQRVSLADDPGDIEVVTTPSGDELLYVSCFRGNRIEVVDARTGSPVGSIRTGQGPSGMAFVDRPELGIRRLYVALFNDHAVGVIELDPASPFYHTEIGEIR